MLFKTKAEPPEEVSTYVWVCSKESCFGWFREDFSFDKGPICLFCKSKMIHSTKMLPVLKTLVQKSR
jgi:hypothetical protein